MLKGLMQDVPLLVSSLIEHAASCHPQVEVVSRAAEGGIHRCTYGDVGRRSKRLAQALMALGVKPGDRIGTLAWNGYRHLETYFGVSGIGAVLHTIHPRQPAEQLEYVINHAEDRYLFFDVTFAPLIVAPVMSTVAVKPAASTGEMPPMIDAPSDFELSAVTVMSPALKPPPAGALASSRPPLLTVIF